MARPAISAILAITLLVGAAWSATDLKTGEPGLNSLPDSDLKTGYEIISSEFYAGSLIRSRSSSMLPPAIPRHSPA